MTSETKRNAVRSHGEGGEALFAIWLIVFAILEIVLTVMILINAVGNREAASTDSPSGAQTGTSSTTAASTPESPSSPVFVAGGTLTLPKETEKTVNLSSVDSKYAILINAQTGEILAQKNASIAFSPASMTKVMTLIVACENLTTKDLERKIPLTDEIVTYTTSGSYAGTDFSLPRESNGYSCIGDTYRIRDLLYGIGVASAADCTYMIVKEISGSEEAFVALMNQKALELGLSGTHFDNAVGFDSPNNVTTASDMAAIMSYAMQSELIVDILKPRQEKLSIKAHYVDSTGGEKTYNVDLKSSLKSRLEKYPEFKLTTSSLYATKTGYTSGSFIVVTVTGKADGAQYVLVLGDSENPADTISGKFKNTMLDMESILNTYIQ